MLNLFNLYYLQSMLNLLNLYNIRFKLCQFNHTSSWVVIQWYQSELTKDFQLKSRWKNQKEKLQSTTRKGQSKGPAEMCEGPGGPTGQDSSVFDRYSTSPTHRGVIVGGRSRTGYQGPQWGEGPQSLRWKGRTSSHQGFPQHFTAYSCSRCYFE